MLNIICNKKHTLLLRYLLISFFLFFSSFFLPLFSLFFPLCFFPPFLPEKFGPKALCGIQQGRELMTWGEGGQTLQSEAGNLSSTDKGICAKRNGGSPENKRWLTCKEDLHTADIFLYKI